MSYWYVGRGRRIEAKGVEGSSVDSRTCPWLGLAHFLKNASVPSTVFCSPGNWVAIPRMCDCVIVRGSVSIYAALSAVSGPSRVAMRRGRCRKVKWVAWVDDIWVCPVPCASRHPPLDSLTRSLDRSEPSTREFITLLLVPSDAN